MQMIFKKIISKGRVSFTKFPLAKVPKNVVMRQQSLNSRYNTYLENFVKKRYSIPNLFNRHTRKCEVFTFKNEPFYVKVSR